MLSKLSAGSRLIPACGASIGAYLLTRRERIVAAHGGHVTAANADGGGASFVVRLPAA
jgi:K+-sensing histidine kinase KdpD